MIEIDVMLYLETKTRIARLGKRICLPLLPREGEFIKLKNKELGDYFAFQVVQVTHREGGIPEIWITTRKMAKCRMKQEFWREKDLDHDILTYVNEGWALASRIDKRNGAPDKVSQPFACPQQVRKR